MSGNLALALNNLPPECVGVIDGREDHMRALPVNIYENMSSAILLRYGGDASEL